MRIQHSSEVIVSLLRSKSHTFCLNTSMYKKKEGDVMTVGEDLVWAGKLFDNRKLLSLLSIHLEL